jgi:hypothetical protein
MLQGISSRQSKLSAKWVLATSGQTRIGGTKKAPSHDEADRLSSQRLLSSPKPSHLRCPSSAPTPDSIRQISRLHAIFEASRSAQPPALDASAVRARHSLGLLILFSRNRPCLHERRGFFFPEPSGTSRRGSRPRRFSHHPETRRHPALRRRSPQLRSRRRAGTGDPSTELRTYCYSSLIVDE